MKKIYTIKAIFWGLVGLSGLVYCLAHLHIGNIVNSCGGLFWGICAVLLSDRYNTQAHHEKEREKAKRTRKSNNQK